MNFNFIIYFYTITIFNKLDPKQKKFEIKHESTMLLSSAGTCQNFGESHQYSQSQCNIDSRVIQSTFFVMAPSNPKLQ